MAQIFDTIAHYIKTASFLDVIDILVVAFLVYHLLRFIHGTNVRNIVKGILMLMFFFYISDFMGLNVINYVLKNTMQIGLIALIIVFQPELRKALENLGSNKISTFLKREEALERYHYRGNGTGRPGNQRAGEKYLFCQSASA